METVFHSVSNVVLHSCVTEPADNRWLTAYPTAQDTLLMHGFLLLLLLLLLLQLLLLLLLLLLQLLLRWMESETRQRSN